MTRYTERMRPPIPPAPAGALSEEDFLLYVRNQLLLSCRTASLKVLYKRIHAIIADMDTYARLRAEWKAGK